MRAAPLFLLASLSACGGQVVTGSQSARSDDAAADLPTVTDAATSAVDDLPTPTELPPDAPTPVDPPRDVADVPFIEDTPSVFDGMIEDTPAAPDVPALPDVVDVPPPDAGTCVVRDLGSALGDAVAEGSTAGGASAYRGACGGEAGPEALFRWTAPRAGTFTFTTAGSDFDTLVYARASCGGPELGCNDDVVSGVVRSSTLTLDLRAGEPVFLFIDGWEDSAGSYVLNIAEGGPVRCRPGATRSCYGGPAGTVNVGRCRAVTQTCLSQGVWPDLCRGDLRPSAVEVCANRVDDDCDGMTDEGCDAADTRAISGVVTYENRVPNAMRSDWTSGPDAPAPGFAVYSLRGDRMIDATVTSADAARAGSFTLRLPMTPTADDRVVVAALARDDRGVISYAVADPALRPGSYAPHAHADNARVWSWSWRVDALPATNTLRIGAAQGSGAARTFEHLARAVRAAETRYNRRGYSLLAWQGDDVAWSCGACFSVSPTQLFDQGFSSQISMFGGRDDQSYWSPSTITHEAGHWVMASYGVQPREGGTHYLNTPESPGLAWSEGWATWYGAALRDDPVIVSKQRGFMYWFDIGQRRLSSGRPWALPVSTAGLTQPIAENEVSAILWALAPAPRDALYTALASPRMTRSPFLRGYRNPQGANVPYLADFLDALRCAAFPAMAVTAAVRAYPYNPATPLCPMDEAPPLEVTFDAARVSIGHPGASSDTVIRVRYTLTTGATFAAPLRARVELPPGVDLLGGDLAFELPPRGPGVAASRELTLRLRGAPGGDLIVAVESEAEGFGLRGAARYRFDRPAPQADLLRLGDRPLRVAGASLGPSVVVR